MIDVDEAEARLRAGVCPLGHEDVMLTQAYGRTLAAPLLARRTQPPAPLSAMDGYALAAVADAGESFDLVGEAAAGHPFDGALSAGCGVRISTGAVVPAGAVTVVPQEATQADDDQVTVTAPVRAGAHIRPAGGDFHQGQTLLHAGTRLDERHIALAAAADQAWLRVHRAPRVSILATGDELSRPGLFTDRAGEIVDAAAPALAARYRALGADTCLLPIAPDDAQGLAELIPSLLEADLSISIGGASVGPHDRMQQALRTAGVAIDFWKIAMRPGKPLMVGRRERQRVIGLPGNPVSALVCSRLFVEPLLAILSGQIVPRLRQRLQPAPLAHPLAANGPRRHFLRARFTGEGQVEAADSQDSALLTRLGAADCLIVRDEQAPAAAPGDPINILRLN